MIKRILAMVRKEFIQMRRDRLTLGMMLMLPIMQLMLFGFAINTDIKHVPIAVLDYSNSEESRRLLESFTNSQYFVLTERVSHPSEIAELINQAKVKVGIVIDPDYALDLKRKRPARVQVLVDASDPQVAGSTMANAQGVGTTRSLEMLGVRDLPVNIEMRAWFNPDQVTSYHIVPGLIGVILTMTMMMITSMAIVRERETGTLEQLATTPLGALELMIGKIVPYILVGYVQITVALLVGVIVFHVPIRGNLLLLYTLALLQIVAYLGLGLLVSTVAKTQQQAMQMSFFMFLPTMLLSGFMFPRDGMPVPAQKLGLVMPLTYFLQILRGIVNKGLGIEYLWQFILPMLLLISLILGLAVRRFKQTQ